MAKYQKHATKKSATGFDYVMDMSDPSKPTLRGLNAKAIQNLAEKWPLALVNGDTATHLNPDTVDDFAAELKKEGWNVQRISGAQSIAA